MVKQYLEDQRKGFNLMLDALKDGFAHEDAIVSFLSSPKEELLDNLAGYLESDLKYHETMKQLYEWMGEQKWLKKS